MTYILFALLFGAVLGLAAVASNPSPHFAALGLVVAAVMGCGVLIWDGGSFLSLVLVLIYMGGMLVVFAYSSALAAEPFPEVLGKMGMSLTMVWVVLAAGMFCKEWGEGSVLAGGEYDHFLLSRGDMEGVAVMYSSGGWFLIIGGWVLFLTLFVALELVRGGSHGALRAV